MLDTTERYLHWARLGRARFLKEAASAALVVRSSGGSRTAPFPQRPTDDTTLVKISNLGNKAVSSAQLEVFPLAKKKGAAFADMITVGRTPNNDVVLDSVTVSRFHVFFRCRAGEWIVCDTGSKNGTKLNGSPLEPRREYPLVAGALVQVGEIESRFHLVEDLYSLLCLAVQDAEE